MPAVFYHFKQGPVEEGVHQSDGIQGWQRLGGEKDIKDLKEYTIIWNIF